MSAYRPKYKDPKTGELVQSKVWWIEFTIARKRIRESANTTRKTIATEFEKRRRLEMERALAGLPVESATERIKTVAEVIKAYVENYGGNHRHASYLCVKSALGKVERALGNLRLPDLSEDRIRKYIAQRRKEKVCGRTINVELSELSRAIGHPWKIIWPHIRKLEERQDVGRALSHPERTSLLKQVDKSRSPNLKTLIRAALLTGARAGELTSLRWHQVDFAARTLTIGRAKTKAGSGRVIPMNDELMAILAAHAEWFTEQFGVTNPNQCVFPFGSPYPFDPSRSTVEIKTAWTKVRVDAGVDCRWHDLRHTACSDMNEKGISEAVQLAIFGWSSRKMVERYSHIGTASRREAMNSLTLKAPSASAKGQLSSGVPKESPKDELSGLVM